MVLEEAGADILLVANLALAASHGPRDLHPSATISQDTVLGNQPPIRGAWEIRKSAQLKKYCFILLHIYFRYCSGIAI